MKVKVGFLSTVCALMFAPLGQSAVIQLQSDIHDYEAFFRTDASPPAPNPAVSNGTAGDNRIGHRQAGATPNLSSSILPFALPAVSPGDIVSATLTLRFEGEAGANLRHDTASGATANVDLYGLPYSTATGTALQDAARYYSGPNDATAGVTKLQDDIFTPALYPAGTGTADVISVDVSAYLKSLYVNGAVAGNFAILRLSYDVATHDGSQRRYRMVTSGGDGNTVGSSPWTIEQGAPHLTITVVPEPASFGLAAIAACCAIARRRLR